MTEKPKKILLFSETVTLAHAVRPIVLADSLKAENYEIHLAWDNRYKKLFPDLNLIQHQLFSISSEQFITALAKGDPVYNSATLSNYVEQDMQLMTDIKPDVVIGDFRLSLGISAKLLGIPYLNISNIYWSAFNITAYPIPENPLVELFGSKVAQFLFDCVRPAIFALHCTPMNQTRKHFGLPGLGYDLRKVYTHADHVLYADTPELFKLRTLPDNHHFIGPILWSPKTVLPDWWQKLPNDKPTVYISMGSSGSVLLLEQMLAELKNVSVNVLVTTAGRQQIKNSTENVFVADFLPGDQACACADLVICNGGSPTTQQAFAEATPVIGIASNLDQFLNMQAIVRFGAGQLLRADEFNAQVFKEKLMEMLQSVKYAQKAADLQKCFKSYQGFQQFKKVVANI